MEMVSKAHSVCPHFCPCMALIHAIRHADRLAIALRSLAVAAFAVYVQKCVHSLVSKAHSVCPHFCPCMAHYLHAKCDDAKICAAAEKRKKKIRKK